ncbi:MAG: tellurite resistance TerB family protein [Rhodospirillales bacterium]|nr:tellurite resistance TerB family protein [Rhodospirillales bacterium]
MIDPQTALIYTMVMVSAADRDMTDAELQTIGDMVKHLPVFHDYDLSGLTKTAQDCAELLADPDGLDKGLAEIGGALPDKLRETAYALACDVAAADGTVAQEELRLLEWLRHGLKIGRLKAAAIEYGAKVRHATI